MTTKSAAIFTTQESVQATWYVQFYSTSLCKNCQSEPLNWCNDSLICLVMSSNLKHTALNYIYLRGVAELRVFILPFHWIMPGCPNRVIQFVSSLFRSLTCATHLLIFAIVMGVKWYLTAVLTYTSINTNDTWNLVVISHFCFFFC